MSPEFQNKLAKACMDDLMAGPLKGQKLKMRKVDPKSGEKAVIEIGGE